MRRHVLWRSGDIQISTVKKHGSCNEHNIACEYLHKKQIQQNGSIENDVSESDSEMPSTSVSKEDRILFNTVYTVAKEELPTEKVNKQFDKLGIRLSKCSSLATDGAAVMTGRKTGVGIQLKSKYSPFATYMKARIQVENGVAKYNNNDELMYKVTMPDEFERANAVASLGQFYGYEKEVVVIECDINNLVEDRRVIPPLLNPEKLKNKLDVLLKISMLGPQLQQFDPVPAVKKMAFVAVGDHNGHVGLGVKCSKEVATAIRGAIILAKLSVIPVRRGYWGNKIGTPHTVPCKVTGKCGSVLVRLIPAPRGTGIVSAEVPKKLLHMAGIEDCYTAARGCTATLGNFAKATFAAISQTYSYLTPDLWKETAFTKSPYQEFTDYLAKQHRRPEGQRQEQKVY
ncbi:hypothetical protein DPMN_029944 [Dreissena polymorpha]|uniref:Small ribosomal subunit protein uS5 n=1 Tax=Dreissena polymorpha TaxID=45954 RepID=A0A9D4RFR0_DREPO|nr:hypothetical protein DPMN_029944 [Dreissena polymorpha]